MSHCISGPPLLEKDTPLQKEIQHQASPLFLGPAQQRMHHNGSSTRVSLQGRTCLHIPQAPKASGVSQCKITFRISGLALLTTLLQTRAVRAIRPSEITGPTAVRCSGTYYIGKENGGPHEVEEGSLPKAPSSSIALLWTMFSPPPKSFERPRSRAMRAATRLLKPAPQARHLDLFLLDPMKYTTSYDTIY